MYNKWIRDVHLHKDALHKQLGYPSYHHIPPGLLTEISHAKIGTHVRSHKVTRLLKQRVMFAVNVGKGR